MNTSSNPETPTNSPHRCCESTEEIANRITRHAGVRVAIAQALDAERAARANPPVDLGIVVREVRAVYAESLAVEQQLRRAAIEQRDRLLTECTQLRSVLEEALRESGGGANSWHDRARALLHP